MPVKLPSPAQVTAMLSPMTVGEAALTLRRGLQRYAAEALYEQVPKSEYGLIDADAVRRVYMEGADAALKPSRRSRSVEERATTRVWNTLYQNRDLLDVDERTHALVIRPPESMAEFRRQTE